MKPELEYGTGFDDVDDVGSLSGDEVMRRLLTKEAYDHLQELILPDDSEETHSSSHDPCMDSL